MTLDASRSRVSSSGGPSKKRSSLAVKINAGLLAVLIPALVILVLVSCMMSATAVSNLHDQLIDAQTENAVDTVDGFFNSKMTAVAIFRASAVFQNLLLDADTPDTLAKSGKKAAAVNLLNQSYNSMTSDGVQAAWLVGKDNDTYLMETGEMVAANLSTLDWDDEILSTKNTVVTDPYLDPVTGKMVISIVSPVFSANGNDIVGFAGFDVFQDSLSQRLGEIKIGTSGTIELISDNNSLVYSNDPSALNKKVTEISGLSQEYVSKVASGYNGSLTYDYGGVPYRSIFRDSTATGWLAVGSIPNTEVNETRNQLIATLIILSVVILAVLIGIILYLVRKIMRPLSQITKDVEEFSKGNLHVKIDVDTNDEIGVLADSVRYTIQTLQRIIAHISKILSEISNGNLDLMVEGDFAGDFMPIREALVRIIDSLNTTLGQINQSADQVSSGSNQVSSGAQALSQGATEQASSVEELAATISDISGQVKSSAANAAEASGLADSVGSEMNVSKQKMQDMILAMNEITKSSSEISKIIKTIEDIAFQTNILALNAAVEAARAGTAGKGFAVVADEVRNLASKSAEASKSTSSLIEGSLRAVENGTKLADETARSLMTAVEGAQNVSNTINKISDVSKVQADSITQVTQGVDQISTVVQTNSATAEESAAASEELSSQAQVLKTLVGRFNLKHMGTSIDLDYPTPVEYHSVEKSPVQLAMGNDKY